MAKRETRAQERRRALSNAASTHVPGDCDVIVIGGGAAGLAAAITAAEAGASVVVLERDAECGRRILATGNGRCNFANINLDASRYNDPDFVRDVCGPTWLGDVLSFFRSSGLRWCHEEDRLYPLSCQAASVRNVLLARARKAGVVLAGAREVEGITYIDTYPPQSLAARQRDAGGRPDDGMRAEVACSELFSDTGALVLPNAKAVVIASGGEALPAAMDLGLRTAPRRPVLCPIACEDSPLRELDGRRVQALVSLTRAGEASSRWRERGEVLFRTYGLSGVVIFNLSRRADAGDLVELDLAPDLTAAELRELLAPADDGCFVDGSLDGVLDPTIARTLERLARDRWQPKPMAGMAPQEAPRDDCEALVALVKRLPFLVVGAADTNHAQVMRGGFETAQLDPRTLAFRDHRWLFACGEALDVDADCGGFNLAWAWKSGMVAGAAAARKALA